METDKIIEKNVHHGRNIKRIREARNIKQITMAEEMQLSQQLISKLEQKRHIDDETLKKIADYLHVSIEDIKNLEDYPMTIVFENNTNVNNIDQNNGAAGYTGENNSTTHYNAALDKITELYERMLKEERDRNSELEKKSTSLEERVQALENLIKEK